MRYVVLGASAAGINAAGVKPNIDFLQDTPVETGRGWTVYLSSASLISLPKKKTGNFTSPGDWL